jgi:hypothetical protein
MLSTQRGLGRHAWKKMIRWPTTLSLKEALGMWSVDKRLRKTQIKKLFESLFQVKTFT